jgi:transposase
MSMDNLARIISLPELQIVEVKHASGTTITLTCIKTSEFEVCPKCASKAYRIYDHRNVLIKDEPLRSKAAYLLIRKRRFFCKTCRKPFMEPVQGIGKGRRTTHRFQASVCRSAELYSDLKSVQKTHRCSADTVYRATYDQLELNQRKRRYSLPSAIGIDEHSIRKPRFKATIYATMIVDHKNRRVYDLMEGRSKGELEEGLKKLQGCANVKQVTMDLSPTYRALAKACFPNADLIADRFHVQRLFTKKVNRLRKQITGDKRSHPMRKLLLRNQEDLEWYEKRVVWQWLGFHPDLKEMYEIKEAMRRFYKIRGYKRAKKALGKICDRMGQSKSKDVLELRKVLLDWHDEILNYHRHKGMSNGRVEGFNRKAKLCQRRAYGFKTFRNYRLRLLNLCA